MSFQDPLVLLALLALALGVVAYVVVVVRRRRRANEFANPALMVNVAPRSAGWRRHIPLILFAIALAGLIGAAAKPSKTVEVPDERASIMLLTDVSGSMTSTDVRPNRMRAARGAARQFVDDVPKEIKVGVMEFNEQPRTLQRPTRDRAAVRAALNEMTPSGGTATGDAMAAAIQLLRPKLEPGEKPAPAAIVLLSDGESVKGQDPVEVAREAKKQGIPVYTVALGTQNGTIRVKQRDGTTVTQPVPPDPATLRQIARISGGASFSVSASDELGAVYQKLGSQLGHKKEKREVTVWFVGGALALMGLGAAASLGLFGRVV
jgi:Ca-activated chloride channel family protein